MNRKPIITEDTSSDCKRDSFYKIREALLWNRPDEVQALLDAGENPLKENLENAQLLTHAAIGNNPDLVKLMISLGCEPNHANINGRTPLHDAAYSGSTEAVRELISAGANINVEDNRGQTPLTEALRSSHPETAIELIHQGADLDVRDDRQKRTPLMWAVSMKSADLVKLLLQKTDTDIEARDFNDCTPLIYAARSGNPEMVQLLLDAGANLKATDNKGNDVFYWCSPLSPATALLVLNSSSFSPGKATKALLKAASEGHIEIIRILLSKKALIQPDKEGGESALTNAVLCRSPDALQLLLAQPSVQVDYRAGKRLITALATAASIGNPDRTRMLLEAGANLSITDADGKTPVHFAAAKAKLDVVKLLEASGADLLFPAPGKRTLLHLTAYDSSSFAKANERAETFKWLLGKKLDPDAADNAGLTPLMTAALHAQAEVVQLLIDAGANLDMTDNDGRTALYHTVSFGTDYGRNERYSRPKKKASDKAAPVIEALLEAGADPNKCPVWTAARHWRWPGVKSLLKRFGAAPNPS